MPHITFRFYGELNDFIDQDYKHQDIIHFYKNRQSVKDRIEAQGVPHPEVYYILCNGKAVNFDYLIKDGDFISVYPVFRKWNFDLQGSVRKKYRGKASFVLDVHLGKLASYLRMMGFDTLYRNDYKDHELAEINYNTNRILLSRDIGLLKRKIINYAYYIRYDEPRRQLISVLKRYKLYSQISYFGRCVHCNNQLQSIAKTKIIDRLLPKTKKYYNQFYICKNCEQIYWKGSHYKQMKNFIEKIKLK